VGITEEEAKSSIGYETYGQDMPTTPNAEGTDVC
jgi:hypothetical protein